MKEVEQEFLVTKTIQEVEAEKEMDVNYVGVYITNDDKVSSTRSFDSVHFQFNFLAPAFSLSLSRRSD